MPSNISSYTMGTGLLLCAMLGMAGCGQQESRYTEVSEVPPPVAVPAPPREAAPLSAVEGGRGGQVGFTYGVPDGWSEVAPSSMKVLSLMCGEPPEQTVECSVSVFPGDVGGRLANINRWRRQVGLGPLSAEAVDGFVEAVTISEMEGWQVDFTGPGGTNRVVVAVLFHNGQSWFFKLMGPDAAVAEEKAAFGEFLQSVRF